MNRALLDAEQLRARLDDTVEYLVEIAFQQQRCAQLVQPRHVCEFRCQAVAQTHELQLGAFALR